MSILIAFNKPADCITDRGPNRLVLVCAPLLMHLFAISLPPVGPRETHMSRTNGRRPQREHRWGAPRTV